MTEEGRPGSEPGAVEVARMGSIIEAQLLRGFLESEGIPTWLPGEHVIDAYDGAAVLWQHGVPVLVPAPYAAEARRLLEGRRKALADRKAAGEARPGVDESGES